MLRDRTQKLQDVFPNSLKIILIHKITLFDGMKFNKYPYFIILTYICQYAHMNFQFCFSNIIKSKDLAKNMLITMRQSQ